MTQTVSATREEHKVTAILTGRGAAPGRAACCPQGLAAWHKRPEASASAARLSLRAAAPGDASESRHDHPGPALLLLKPWQNPTKRMPANRTVLQAQSAASRLTGRGGAAPGVVPDLSQPAGPGPVTAIGSDPMIRGDSRQTVTARLSSAASESPAASPYPPPPGHLSLVSGPGPWRPAGRRCPAVPAPAHWPARQGSDSGSVAHPPHFPRDPPPDMQHEKRISGVKRRDMHE
eukprot:459021-Hanusia_phi.AAC.1